MTWALAASAAITVATSAASAHSAASAGAKQAGRQSKAEGEAITKERVNATIRNSYSTAMGQVQLALQKKQLAQAGAGVTAAKLSAKGDAVLSQAATGSIGASTAAVMSDIDMKADAAQATLADSYESAVENYNTNLNTMVLNTDQSKPTVTNYEYTGPSGNQMLAGAMVQGATQFASQYALRSASLGLGDGGGGGGKSNPALSPVSNDYLGFNPGEGSALGVRSNFFNTKF